MILNWLLWVAIAANALSAANTVTVLLRWRRRDRRWAARMTAMEAQLRGLLTKQTLGMGRTDD